MARQTVQTRLDVTLKKDVSKEALKRLQEIQAIKVGVLIGLKAMGWWETDRINTDAVSCIVTSELRDEYCANTLAHAIYNEVTRYYRALGEDGIPVIPMSKRK